MIAATPIADAMELPMFSDEDDEEAKMSCLTSSEIFFASADRALR